MNSAILYTFRRCPYAMRARIGLYLSQLNPSVREIELKNKPQEMLTVSAKGTVPVLITAEQQVIAESIEIMQFALTQHPDPSSPWLTPEAYQTLLDELPKPQTMAWVHANDNDFKPWLDKYKYADRFPEHSQTRYRQQAEVFLQLLEDKLAQQAYLCADSPTLADFATFPFIRQFANVEPTWFNTLPYPKVSQWLTTLVNSALFQAVMHKYALWLPEKNMMFLKQSQQQNVKVIPLCKN
ncbi:glutathione S-transferase [Shewanella saliphila]|uniref:Glutathione S-transferase n=1 Tax=Shewanella saliphila TaxID=2282698 RepID=A0ABQ2Q636_9GAMM|nr:glutathione S-transferase [Shewanella saliphila]MCL1102004.1 glutathione S-transferase [Shewanella saliphila]GGP53748.1 glutathione S-transferase [Shewanella saliphila]